MARTKALREGEKHHMLGRDWSVTCKNDMQGYSHPWTSFGLLGRGLSGLIFDISGRTSLCHISLSSLIGQLTTYQIESHVSSVR